ncbi:MAG: diguanylate cyclase [Syntrophomonadaceae bacterium]|nr:diguanylate cyclase [Syntrophomonadaceae bacterium]
MDIFPPMLCIKFLDALPDAVIAINPDHRIIVWNSTMERITGIPREQALGKGNRFYSMTVFGEPRLMLVDLVLDPGLEKEYQGSYRKYGMNYYGDGTVTVKSNKNEVFYWAQASPVFDQDENLAAVIEIMRVKSSDSLRESEYNLRRITDNMSDLVSELDCHGNVIFASPSHYKVLGYTEERMMTIKLSDFVHPEDIPSVISALKKSLQTGKAGISHHRCRHNDGHYVWIETVGNPILQDGKIRGILLSSRDITVRKQLEQELRYLSIHDSLTSLYNRTYFEEEMRRLNSGRCDPVGMMVFDLDGLKLVNDTLGHEAGDRLLINFAGILSKCFRSGDVVSRVGGDEFAVLLPQTNQKALDRIAARLNIMIGEYNQSNPELPLSVSLGIAVKKDRRSSLRDIYKEADNRMYRSKLRRSSSAHSAVVNTLLKALQARDYMTEGHGERMKNLVALLGRELKLSDSTLTNLELLAQFHDIGKVGIPDRILFKRESLTEEEYREMQRHSEIGQRIALASSELSSLADLILKHHEWWDGRGYPFGLAGEQIPLECRIISLVDAYDTMTHDRPYSKAVSPQEALEEIARCSGTQFDPNITALFLKLLGYSG